MSTLLMNIFGQEALGFPASKQSATPLRMAFLTTHLSFCCGSCIFSVPDCWAVPLSAPTAAGMKKTMLVT